VWLSRWPKPYMAEPPKNQTTTGSPGAVVVRLMRSPSTMFRYRPSVSSRRQPSSASYWPDSAANCSVKRRGT